MPDSQNGLQDEEGYGIYVDQIGAGPYSQFERPSYVLENLKWGTPGLGNAGGTITWAILGAGQSLASNNPYTTPTSVDPVFAATIRAAFDRWEQVANLDFVETTNPATADMVVAFDELTSQSANTIGLAQYYYIGSRLTRSYISLDLNRRYQTLDGTTYTVGTSSGSALNLYTLTLHEIGHSIGLGHEDDFDTVMNSISDGVLTDLTSDDIAGARAIYGTAGSTPPTVDDYAATTATTGAVTVGGSVTGRVDTTSDEDWFRITLTAGVSYRIDLRGYDSTGGTLLDPYLRLLNSGGSALATDDDAGTGTDSQILFTATSSGTYYIAASGFDGEQGTYTLAVSTTSTGDDYSSNTGTTGAVAVGGSTTGRLETSTDTDWFAITLTGNRSYRIDLRGTASGGGTLSDPYVRIRSSSGVIYASDDDSGTGTDAQLTYTAAFTGVHYIEASAGATVTGTYTLSVTDNGAVDDFAGTSATTGVVTATATTGTAVSGQIGAAGDTDWFRITLTAGASYRLRLTNGTLPAAHLSLLNSSGTALASDVDGSGNPEIVYTATTTGTYYLDARAATATATGTYTVAADNLSLVDDFAATTATTGTVTPAVAGTAVSGIIGSAGDTDWFRATLTAGASYRLRLTNGTLAAAHLYLRNSAGTILTSDIDGNGNPEILYTPTVTGTYYLDARAATSTGAGTYTVAIDNLTLADDYAATTATTGAIAVGATATGNIGVAADVDWLRVTLTAGTLYQFDGRGSAGFNGTLADPTMQLLNSSGTALRTDNDSGDGSDARILYTPTASGIYYLAMRSTSATATGTYTVGVTANPDDFAATTTTTGVAGVGSTTAGIVERAGDRDWFRAILTAGTTYSIEVRGTSPGSGIRWTESSVILHDSAGATVRSDTQSGLAAAARLTYTPTTTGAFYIDALAYSTGVGAYTVTVTAGAAQQAPVTLEESGAAQQALATFEESGAAQQAPAAIAQAETGITAADLAALTAAPAIDLWDLPAATEEYAVSMLTQLPAFTLLPSYEINSPEDEHRLANTARFAPLFQLQQRTAFDLLPLG